MTGGASCPEPPPSEADQPQTRCTANCSTPVRSDRPATRVRRTDVQKWAAWCMIRARPGIWRQWVAAMPISPVLRDEISKAMDRFDNELRASPLWTNWESNQTHRYAIKKEGKLYPVNQIISMATGASTLSFGGGSEANKYLQEQGFEIVPLRASEHSGVFLLQGGDSLIPMEPASFAKEDDFQRLLSRFPQLLVGDQVNPQNPRRWALVRRELPISTGEPGASQWSIDHVFL
jgi:hypothetical protein